MSDPTPEATRAAMAMVGAFASSEAVGRLAATLDALAAVAQGSAEERLQAAAVHLVTDAQSEIDRLRRVEATHAECVGLIGQLDEGHASYCPLVDYSTQRCRCDFDAREALRKLAGLA